MTINLSLNLTTEQGSSLSVETAFYGEKIMSMVSNFSENDVRNMVLDAYGKIEVYERTELDTILTRDGDIKMDSAPAATIIAKIEKQIGRELPEPSDLRPEEFSSINSIVSLITRKLSEGDGKPLKRTPIETPIVAR